MNRATVGDLRVELSRVAATSGFAVTDQRFFARLNECVLELIHEGDWPGVVDRYNFRVTDGWIVLPEDIDRLVGVAINGDPVQMRSPWYEYMASGPGPQDTNGWTNIVLDRGETCTIEELPASDEAWDIQVRGEVDERIAGVRPVIIIQGYSESGRWIRTTYNGKRIDGVAVEIDGDSDIKEVIASVKFRAIEAIIKPVTLGYVELWASQNSGPETLIGLYAPRSTKPSFRRYFVPSISTSGITTVTTRVRHRFVPVSDDNDFLLITNANALKMMMRACQKKDADNFDDYAKIKLLAIDILKKETRSYFGKSMLPAISIAKATSVGGSITPLM